MVLLFGAIFVALASSPALGDGGRFAIGGYGGY
jgi:hypothetical protein